MLSNTTPTYAFLQGYNDAIDIGWPKNPYFWYKDGDLYESYNNGFEKGMFF